MLWLRFAICKVQIVNSENINDKMVKCTIWYLAVLFTLLEVFVRTQISVRDTAHGFIQNNNEVRYLVDDISTMHKEFAPGIRNTKLHDARLNSFLRFEPEFLDFKERPLGVPHLEKVTLFNINSNKSIDMTSISGNTVHFHSSFFEDKKIPPLGNTTFNVVFLGREEGEIESNLFIHTTEGSYKYQVRGASAASPYRLRPIVDIRVPLNASFSPLIYMHNPHTEAIQIIEVYSSGGEFHLELPTGELEGPKGMWEIPPFQTKPIIRVRFNARTESNYTAYVRIKVNGIKDVLVVPLEVEVSAQCGLHTPQGTVDFGVGGTLDKPKEMKLLVFNSLKKPVRIQSVTTSTKAIRVEFQPVKVLPELKEPFGIATLYLDWKNVWQTKDFYGKIVVKHKQGKSEIEIPYWATVFEGGLHYNASSTKFLIDKGSVENRNFTVVNKYEYPLAITNISLPKEAQLYFSIKKFKPRILQPSAIAVLFELILKSEAVSSDLKLKTFLVIHTNISNVEVPLLSYNGKLTLMLPGQHIDNNLDLGLVGSDSTKESHFLLLNNNPVDVKIVNIGNSIQSGTVHLIGCARENHSNDIHFPPSNMTKCTYLKSGEYAVFRVLVQTSRSEGQVLVQTFVQTQFEKIIIPIRFKVAQGKLEIGPDRLVFDECFPGKICTHPLRIHSTFVDPMVIQSISSIPPDPRLSSSHSVHITSRSAKIIGHLFLDPVLGCRNHCYTGLSLNSSIGAQWLKSFSLPSATCDLDLNLLNIFYGRYLNITTAGKKWHNLTLRLDTTEVKGHFFHTRVKMSWPKLIVGQSSANKSVFMFPLTQIGNISYKNITIRNPSNAVLTLQLIMDWAYPQAKNLFKNLPSNFIPGLEESQDSDAFFFHESHNINRSEFITNHDVYVHHKSVPITIPARETVHVTIGFKATVTTLKSALMFIRNNLTIMEVVRLTGQGAHPSFKFGNRKPGSVLPLLFELTEKHLRDCEKEKNRKNPAPNLTVKRSFTARNTGDISVTVHAFYINRFPCEGYGFKVLNCMPFELAPNATRKIDIAFTPDFTLSKIHRTLILHSSLNIPVNYTLITTVPPYFLSPCASVLARPTWEPLLYYACISLMIFLLFIVVSVCFIESDRILRSSLTIRDDLDTQPLDLRLIGTQTRSEIRSHKSELENDWNCVQNGTISIQNSNKCLKESRNNDSIYLKSGWHSENKENNLYKFDSQKITKKKLNKKNSLESNVTDTSQDLVQKKSWSNILNRTPPNKNTKQNIQPEISEDKKSPILTKTENVKKVSPVKVEPKKKNICKKSKVPDLPCSEEETSSTTTESSNNEEIEKFSENQPKQDKLKKILPLSKKNKSPNCDFRDYEGDGEDEEFEKEPNNVTKRWTPKENKPVKEDKQDSPRNVQESRTKNTKNNPRKEKSCQKRRNDKSTKSNAHDLSNSSSLNVSVSPPIPPVGVWGENRATFSDVVARSDASQFSQNQRISQTPLKPTLYVEPTQKQKEPKTNVELGPIGSKKPEWSENKSYQNNVKPLQLSNSFFTEPEPFSVEQGPYFDVPEIWANQDLFQSPKEPVQEVPSLSPFHENWNHGSVWEPLCAPVGENRPQQSLPNDFFWGSAATPVSPVWGMSPWAPIVPNEPLESANLPVRSPPGFNSRDDSETRVQNFDPFSSFSNIWTPHNPDTWTYNPHNQFIMCLAGNTTMDTIYPEPMSLLHRRVVPKKRKGRTSRYRTQPVTFSEIKEVDEENLEEGTETTAAVSTRSEQDINRRFEEFIKSREKILSQIEKSAALTEENLVSAVVTVSKESSCQSSCTQNNRFSSRPSI